MARGWTFSGVLSILVLLVTAAVSETREWEHREEAGKPDSRPQPLADTEGSDYRLGVNVQLPSESRGHISTSNNQEFTTDQKLQSWPWPTGSPVTQPTLRPFRSAGTEKVQRLEVLPTDPIHPTWPTFKPTMTTYKPPFP